MHDHTVSVEGVIPVGQVVIGLGNPVDAILHSGTVMGAGAQVAGIVVAEVVVVHFTVRLHNTNQTCMQIRNTLYNIIGIVISVGIQTGIVAEPLFCFVQIQIALLLYQAVLDLHSAVGSEFIGLFRQQTVGLGNPVLAVAQDLVRGIDIVVITVNLDNAGISTDTVDIVVQFTVLFHDAVLQLRLDLGILYGRIGLIALIQQDLTVGIQRIALLLNQTVGLGDPGGAVLHQEVLAVEVVVVAIHFHNAGPGNYEAVLDPVGLAQVIIEAAVFTDPSAVLVHHDIPDSAVGSVTLGSADFKVLVLLAVVDFTVNGGPAAGNPCACPTVTVTLGILDDLTAGQNIIGKDVIITVDPLIAVHGCTGTTVKEVVLGFAIGGDGLPALSCLTVNGVMQAVAELEHTGHSTDAAAVLTEGVIQFLGSIFETGQQVDALADGLIVHKVVQMVFNLDPALAVGLIQNELICKGGVGVAEACASFGVAFNNHIGVHEGNQAVDCLIHRLHSKVIQCVCTQEDVVADIAADLDIQLIVAVPCSACLGLCLDAAQNADGITCSRIQSLLLVHPAAGQRYRVGSLIQNHILLVEVIVHDLQFGDIHIQVLIELGNHRDLSQHTDTLCQLHQEVPCGGIDIIAVGQHVNNILQLFGNADRSHIQCKGVFHIHALLGIGYLVSQAVHSRSVIHNTVPCQNTVAGCNSVKIKDCFICLEQIHNHVVIDFVIIVKLNRKLQAAHSEFFVGNESNTIDICNFIIVSGIFIAQIRPDIIQIIGNRIAVIGTDDRQFNLNIVDCVNGVFGKLNAVGNDHLHGLLAHDLVVQNQLNFHAAQVQSRQNAVFADLSDGLITDLPLDALGDLCCVAGSTDTYRRHLHLGIDGQIVVFGSNACVFKFIGDNSGRYCHQGGTDAALITVGGVADNANGIAALRLGSISSGTAAIQMQGDHAACVNHDLCDFSLGSTGRQRTLTAVQNSKDHLAAGGNTHTGSGTAIGIVGTGAGNRLTVAYNDNTAADSFLDLACVGVPLGAGCNNGRAIFQDCEEVVAVCLVIGNAFHDQCTAGLTVAHVIEVSVDACHGGIMLNVIGGILGIGVLILCCVHLIGDTLHAPALGRIVVFVVCVNIDIISGDIDGADVVSHLLTVLGQRITDFLGDAGGQGALAGGENLVELVILGILGFIRRFGIFGILAVVAVQAVTAQLEDVVSKGIAAGGSQIMEIGDIAVCFQNLQADVAHIAVINCLADIFVGLQTLEAVIHKVSCTVSVGQFIGEVALHNGAQLVASLQHLVQIESIHITVEVVHAESIVGIHAEAVALNKGSHLFHSTFGDIAAVCTVVHQVANITGPAAQVSGSLHIHIGNVQRTKHVAEVYLITVRQGKRLDVAQLHYLGALCRILLLHKFGKSNDLLAGQLRPQALVVTVNTGTDKIDGQFVLILGGSCRKALCVAFQNLQILQKLIIIVHIGLAVGDHHRGLGLGCHGFGCLRFRNLGLSYLRFRNLRFRNLRLSNLGFGSRGLGFNGKCFVHNDVGCGLIRNLCLCRYWHQQAQKQAHGQHRRKDPLHTMLVHTRYSFNPLF